MRHIVLLIVTAAAAASALSLPGGMPLDARADGAPGLPLRFIDVLGRVTDPNGTGLESVQVSVEGSSEATATTGADGAYTLSVPVAAPGSPPPRNVTLRIAARRAGWAFTLRNGQGALAIELRMQKSSDPLRCRVRASVAQTVDVLSAALSRGDRNAVVASVDFTGSEGTGRTGRVTLRSQAITAIGMAGEADPMAVNEREPAQQDKVAPSSEASPAPASQGTERRVPTPPQREQPAPPRVVRSRSITIRPDSTRSVAESRREADRPSPRSRIRRIEAQDRPRETAPETTAMDVIKMPGPGVTQTDASLIRRIETTPGPAMISSERSREDMLAGEGECACRIKGTVEIHPDHLLTRRLDLIVSLRESPAVRDTIQLFMGSPRAFELPAIRCGTWHIDVDAVAQRAFSVVSTDGRGPVDCRQGGLQQLRVVLTPR